MEKDMTRETEYTRDDYWALAVDVAEEMEGIYGISPFIRVKPQPDFSTKVSITWRIHGQWLWVETAERPTHGTRTRILQLVKKQTQDAYKFARRKKNG